MNDTSKLSPDDPKLTAYALGELDGAERAAVEAAVQADPALQAAVAELRAFAGDLTGALAQEPVPSATCHTMYDKIGEPPAVSRLAGDSHTLYDKAAVTRVEGVGRNGAAMATDAAPDPYRRKIVRFPLYYVISGLAAASFAVVVWLHDDDTPTTTKEEVRVFEVNLEPASALEKAPTAPKPMLEAEGAAVGDSVQPKVSAREPAPTATRRPAPAPTPLLEQVKRDSSGASVGLSPAFAMPPSLQQSEPGGLPAAKLDTNAGLRAAEKKTNELSKHAVSFDDSRVASTSASATYGAKHESRLQPVALGADADALITGAPAIQAAPPMAGVAGGTFGRADRPIGDVPPPLSMRGFASVAEREPASPLPAHLAPNTEAYAYVQENAFLGAAENPLSTFSIDVDTASYANVRRFLRGGRLPPRDAVRIEELVNYFPYRYAPPAETAMNAPREAAPFAAHLEVASAPWAPEHRLVRIGLKGREVTAATRPAANLVFLLDVSGSMNAANKLPLVKESMRMLLGKLRADDRVAIVTYAGASGLALPSTAVKQKADILASLDMLRPGGSTNGAMGIQLAYDVAKANFVAGGLNRVILCTDGDFNVGVTSQGELVRLVEQKAKNGVFLTVLGFGMGNYKDAMLEQLADKGNGAYGYIDTQREARKLLVEQVEGTLAAIAKDVKVQVEFNPAKVAAYRLVGYENRLLKKEDFNNDEVDAGEIGAGHTVTALYEVVPAGVAWTPDGAVDELKYQKVQSPEPRVESRTKSESAELLTVKVRYKAPDGDTSRKLEFPLTDLGTTFGAATADFKFAAAVASFGLVLRDSTHKGAATLAKVIDWAEDGLAEDPEGYRAEFIELVRTAQALAGE